MLDEIIRLKDYLLCATTLGTTMGDRFAIFQQTTKNFRARMKWATHEPTKILSFQTRYGPLFFRDNFGDITNLVNLIYRQEYRWKRLSHPGVIVDIGANIGMAAVWFAHHNPDHDLFCFEPIRSNTNLIRLNCPRAKTFEVAVGADEGEVTLRVDRDEVMASFIPCPWDTRDIKFPMTTLDNIATQEKWKEIALLKVDVEGMESEILKGATNALQMTHQVVMETHSRKLHEETIQHLKEAGFVLDSENWKNTTGLLFASRKTESRER